MALVVEDGTGLPTANSYLSVATADAYHTEICNEGWGGGQTKKEAALIRATRWIDQHFDFLGGRIVLGDGTVTNLPQALNWPREGVVHEEGFAISPDTVPTEIVQATAEVALAVMDYGDLEPSAAPGGTVSEELEKTGRTWVQTKFSAGGDAGEAQVPVAASILEPLLALGSQRKLNRS